MPFLDFHCPGTAPSAEVHLNVGTRFRPAHWAAFPGTTGAHPGPQAPGRPHRPPRCRRRARLDANMSSADRSGRLRKLGDAVAGDRQVGLWLSARSPGLRPDTPGGDNHGSRVDGLPQAPPGWPRDGTATGDQSGRRSTARVPTRTVEGPLKEFRPITTSHRWQERRFSEPRSARSHAGRYNPAPATVVRGRTCGLTRAVRPRF